MVMVSPIFLVKMSIFTLPGENVVRNTLGAERSDVWLHIIGQTQISKPGRGHQGGLVGHLHLLQFNGQLGDVRVLDLGKLFLKIQSHGLQNALPSLQAIGPGPHVGQLITKMVQGPVQSGQRLLDPRYIVVSRAS